MKKTYTTPAMRIFYLSAKDNVMLSTSNGEADPNEDVLSNEYFGSGDDEDDAFSWGWKH